MSKEKTLIRLIARDLRYRSIEGLIGRNVTIHDLDSVETDICAALSDSLPQNCRYIVQERRFLEGAILKYGVIDATFTAPDNLLSSRDQGGVSLLRELGFIEDQDQEGQDTFSDLFGPDSSCLELLAEDFEKKCAFLKLFLSADGPARDGFELMLRVREGESLTLPEGYLPRTFQVQDACITNSDFVWFQKHFYL